MLHNNIRFLHVYIYHEVNVGKFQSRSRSETGVAGKKKQCYRFCIDDNSYCTMHTVQEVDSKEFSKRFRNAYRNAKLYVNIWFASNFSK